MVRTTAFVFGVAWGPNLISSFSLDVFVRYLRSSQLEGHEQFVLIYFPLIT